MKTGSNNNHISASSSSNNNNSLMQQQHQQQRTTTSVSVSGISIGTSSQIVTEWEDGIIFDVDDPDFCNLAADKLNFIGWNSDFGFCLHLNGEAREGIPWNGYWFVAFAFERTH
ncbi:hypothetical protein M5D96_004354 [Drosophila gunungcola]|uniref:Uncharacterized protein n=1 Tax=Drosophila gunungcola TaxID=103775 RepID=A0A9P9YTT5_9MUSC|nr:hypothetical protein M5D96_004354 [Drosophila gunungcola]